MNIQRFEKLEIALNQLETALGLFFAKRELFSVITLAGAAEEILGQLLRQKTAPEGSRLSTVWNLLRPGKAAVARGASGTGRETELHVHMDVQEEALFLLGRAVDDYQALTGGLSAGMQRFNEEYRERKG